MAERGNWKLEIGGVVFADYEDIVQPTEGDGGPAVQRTPLFRGEEIRNDERGNFDQVSSFYVLIEQADFTAAWDWYLKAAQNWNGVRSVVATYREGAGTKSWRIRYPIVRVSATRPTGVANEARVTITGGKWEDGGAPFADAGNATADSGGTTDRVN